ncbi:putative Rossmann fold nucleotide-binding protein involved in DNA uptake [Sphaerochaeta pleomorpha str. Grapes]|uniref:Putative Rossmann fold nucleotide-binding protein involved in DNA uptake n=1 Tax=Sphaerochaeta pleomorpha (strain ATCC BAA-1885 / DSM 22778 / Grapes) TaxID=158190 RepID=G8QXD5_SPHPG|nr:DNA-processing protein DprA [Sphaerochaeta pleomorpha]AEV28436.1 putative Rossmann fold nucleotide-binding protein involved in DNA uptake [Sphaerochaeta pleomorpha str. Grapes]
MKLSVLLALSMLPLQSREMLALAYQGPDFNDLQSKYPNLNLRSRVDRFRLFLAHSDTKVVFLGMDGYPSLPGGEDNPPFRLCYQGFLPNEGENLVSVCGTRYPDTLGTEASYAFSLEAGLNMTHVVTSHSRGIDKAALYGARESGLPAYVCCDCGLSTRRITENRLLAGCNLISPFEPDDTASRWRCLSRNYLTCAFSPALVVFQAPAKSGALACSSLALDIGREVFVHETGLRKVEVNEGTLRLANEGCPPIGGYPDVAKEMGFGQDRSLVPCKESNALYRYGNTCYSLKHETE